MNNLKKQIEEILRSYFVDKDKDNHWGTPERVDQLYEAFQKTYLEAIGEVYPGKKIADLEDYEIDSEQYFQAKGWNEALDQYEKNLREAIKEK